MELIIWKSSKKLCATDYTFKKEKLMKKNEEKINK